jgi:hypothetical protein
MTACGQLQVPRDLPRFIRVTLPLEAQLFWPLSASRRPTSSEFGPSPVLFSICFMGTKYWPCRTSLDVWVTEVAMAITLGRACAGARLVTRREGSHAFCIAAIRLLKERNNTDRAGHRNHQARFPTVSNGGYPFLTLLNLSSGPSVEAQVPLDPQSCGCPERKHVR